MPQHLVSGPLRDQVGILPKSWLASLWVFDPVWGEHPSATSNYYRTSTIIIITTLIIVIIIINSSSCHLQAPRQASDPCFPSPGGLTIREGKKYLISF